jgi:hypothetical protein
VSGGAPFSRGAAAALVAGGFALFLALLFLIGKGENPLADTRSGEAHALATGLNGYAGLARLLAASNYEIKNSRSPGGLETRGILVITPPAWGDSEEIGALLDRRRTLGPTLVIVPKWFARPPPDNLPREAANKFKRGWVVLGGAAAPDWPAQLKSPFGFTATLAELGKGEKPRWQGFGRSGTLPTRAVLHAETNPFHEVLIEDAAGHALAVRVRDAAEESVDEYAGEAAHWVIFLTEPDLANNFGLADPARAAAAIALVQELDYDAYAEITFDMTLNGFGASENLLTLAFRPPFLAATLCLILTLALVFWRSMLRFGPAAASAPAAAFGKQQLVTNGAGLIVRAERWGLLARPYAALAERRIARALGLARSDPAAIDRALAQRLPNEEPFTARAARLEAARNPADILSAAHALDTLARKLDQ